MEEKKVTKISLSTVFLILAIIVIIVMGIFIYKLNKDKTAEIKKSTELQAQVNSLNGTVDELQEKINKVAETINTETSKQSNSSNVSSKNITTNNSDKNDVTYTVSVRDEVYATIKATKNGKTISKEFEMEAMIANTGTIEISNIGTVALVAESGGEYYGVSIYQLINDEIKLIGTIDCGSDMVKEATYTVKTKNETTAVINARINNENITKEFEMSAEIANTSVIDVFNRGKVVLVAETGGEYYGIQVYRLSEDYTNGKSKEIKKVGSIQYNL